MVKVKINEMTYDFSEHYWIPSNAILLPATTSKFLSHCFAPWGITLDSKPFLMICVHMLRVQNAVGSLSTGGKEKTKAKNQMHQHCRQSTKNFTCEGYVISLESSVTLHNDVIINVHR